MKENITFKYRLYKLKHIETDMEVQVEGFFYLRSIFTCAESDSHTFSQKTHIVFKDVLGFFQEIGICVWCIRIKMFFFLACDMKWKMLSEWKLNDNWEYQIVIQM